MQFEGKTAALLVTGFALVIVSAILVVFFVRLARRNRDRCPKCKEGFGEQVSSGVGSNRTENYTFRVLRCRSCGNHWDQKTRSVPA